jgi:TetR/AcrR family fatty acid metabolism transcriptional regulator
MMIDNPTKKLITAAATEVIYEKGYHEAKIADIAKRAGMTPSVIYKYFPSKAALLFSIPLENSIRFFEILKNDLQGIEGNENLLRKLIWSLFRFYELHPEYAIILLMECRSNKAFYKTEAYTFIKRTSTKFLTIFEEGKQNGEFEQDVKSIIVRDLIFGSMDYSVVDCLVLKETESLTGDLKGIFQLFKNMTLAKPSSDRKRIAKRNLLFDAAIQVFGQKGYYDATISNIAKKAGVSDGIVYEYFENKEDLLFSIAERKLKEDLLRLNEMFHIKDPKRKLRRFIKSHCGLYLNNRDYLKIHLLLIQTNRHFYQKAAFESFKQYREFLLNVLEEGKQSGVFRPEIDSRIFANMVFGGLTHMFLRWIIVAKVSETDKMNEIEEVTNLLTASVSIIQPMNGKGGTKP